MTDEPGECLERTCDPVYLAERILIVPRAHTAIFETRFQIEMYALFHRSLGSRIGHNLGTPSIVLGVFVLLQSLGHSLWPGLVVLAAIVGLGVRMDVLAASIVAVLGGLLLAVAAWWAEVSPESSMLWGAVLVGVGGIVQTVSHMFEDVPPPHSGASRFVPMKEWMAQVDLRELMRSTALTLGVFLWLELWAAPRIWTIQVLQMLMAAGYRPDLRAALESRSREILAHPTSDWRRPASLSGA